MTRRWSATAVALMGLLAALAASAQDWAARAESTRARMSALRTRIEAARPAGPRQAHEVARVAELLARAEKAERVGNPRAAALFTEQAERRLARATDPLGGSRPPLPHDAEGAR